MTTTGHHPAPPPRARLVPASTLRPATVPVRGGSASCAACRVGAAPCWHDIRQLPAPGPTVRSACPRAVRPRREPRGASPVQPRRASGRLVCGYEYMQSINAYYFNLVMVACHLLTGHRCSDVARTRDWFAPTGTRSCWNSLLDCEKTLRATPTQQAC